MANRPKPTKLKILEGNPGRRPINLFEPEPPDRKPRMPTWLKDFPVAVKEWRRVLRELGDMGLLSSAEEGVIAKLCLLEHMIQDLVKEKDSKEFLKIKNLIDGYRILSGNLGLDPTGRTRLKTNKPRKKSKAEAFRARKRGKKT